MKRILCALLVLVLIVMGVTACGEQSTPPETDQQTEAPETEASLPDGYTKYDNGAVSFAYPADWIEQDGSTVILVNASGVGNNITVVYEAKNDFFWYAATGRALFGTGTQIDRFATNRDPGRQAARTRDGSFGLPR